MKKSLDISEIKSRMRELGYNQRSLSMKATGKPDNLRNLFRGKSQNLRGDNYKAVVSVLWPENGEPVPKSKASLNDCELGLLSAIEGVISVLSIKNLLKQDDLKLVFNHQLKEFRMHDQLGAADVMVRLIASLDPLSHA